MRKQFKARFEKNKIGYALLLFLSFCGIVFVIAFLRENALKKNYVMGIAEVTKIEELRNSWSPFVNFKFQINKEIITAKTSIP